MSYFPTQADIKALSYPQKILYTKILLLNENYQTIYEMKYEYISGDISTNIDSDIRNTMTMLLAVTNRNVGIEEDKLLWINKFIKVLVGVKAAFHPNILWYDKGIFVMTDYSYNKESKTIHINCSDLICKLNGDVGGSLEGLTHIIYAKDKFSVREAIIKTLTDLTPFHKYYIADMPKLIPYDLEFSSSDTVWTILTRLRDLYPSYEMFFDTDGTFICKKVATLDSDPIVLDDSILQRLYISETDNGVLKDIRNVSKVWGKCLDTDYYTETCTYDKDKNIYKATFNDLPLNEDGSLPTSTKFAIKMPAVNTKEEPRIEIVNKITASEKEKSVGTFNITDSLEKPVGKNFFLANRSFVFRYRRKALYALGQYQIVAVNILRNTKPTDEQKKKDIEKHGCDDITYTVIPDCPFSIEKIGERVRSYSGGNYDDIQAIDDCITRAEYETWLSAKVVYTVALEMVYIPWLQGNEKIRFTLSATNETKDWVVTSISSSHPQGIMSLALTEFTPLYNFDVKEPEHKLLEYIETNGTQYIHLSLEPDKDTKVEMEFQLTNKDAKANYCLFGADGQFSFRWVGENNCFRTNGNGTEYKDFSTTITPLEKHTVIKTSTETIIDGTHKQVTTPPTTSNPLLLFAYNDPTEIKDYAKTKVYSVKVYQSNQLIRDLIPVKTEYETICMYDKVNKMYYYNRGTGDFIAGKEIEPTDKK